MSFGTSETLTVYYRTGVRDVALVEKSLSNILFVAFSKTWRKMGKS